METMSEMGADGSEAGSELADRVAAMARVLVEHGCTGAKVAMAMKIEYDPANLFRLNQNIKPTV